MRREIYKVENRSTTIRLRLLKDRAESERKNEGENNVDEGKLNEF